MISLIYLFIKQIGGKALILGLCLLSVFELVDDKVAIEINLILICEFVLICDKVVWNILEICVKSKSHLYASHIFFHVNKYNLK